MLPAGITAVSGDFERGDLIDIYDLDHKLIARGLASYSSAEANMLKGHKSADFEKLIGYQGRAELIHADDLVVIAS